MIKRLEFNHFRGILKGKLSLEKFTLLVGRNNSGKSTILEALFLLPSPSRETVYGTAISSIRELHDTLSSTGYSFLLYNYIADSASVIYHADSFITHLDILVKEKTISVEMVWKRDSEIVREHLADLGSDSASFSVTSLPELGKEIGVKETVLITPSLIKRAWIHIKNNWEKVTQQGIDREVAEEISRLIGEEFVGMTLEPLLGGKLSLNFQDKKGRRFRLGDMGDGVQLLATAALLVKSIMPNLLLWDDVEAHMNPVMLSYTLKWLGDLVKKGTQVVISTHSLEVVRYASQLLGDERWFGIRLLSLKKGELKEKKLGKKEIEELEAAGVDVRVAEALL